MRSSTTSAFNLPESRAFKDALALIDADEDHFALIAESLELSVDGLTRRLESLRKSPGGKGRQAADRDLEIHQVTARLRTLRRFSLDLCLGRVVFDDGQETLYIGRIGLTDAAGRTLLVDWRTPAAEPFFAATPANPLGVASRRRYRWTHGRITDYWDEVFTADAVDGHVSLDDESAFIASLGASRSPRMRDVLGTIASDQDAIIRAGSRGALVVDGGPGTGKTVVALHRAAYLIYADPRLSGNRGGVLVVGPHEPYLAYVADVLPSLGEESVQTCTLRDLVAEGRAAGVEADPRVADLKSTTQLVSAIETAVKWYEEPPRTDLTVETHWDEVRLTVADWARAFDVPEPGTPHNEGRDQIWAELVRIIRDKHHDDVPVDLLRKSLARNEQLTKAVNRAWPVLEPTDVIADLWSVPAFLRMCAPWLSADEIALMQREDPYGWTVSDLPLLDAARQRIGDPAASRHRRQREEVLRSERARMDQVVDDLLDAHTYDDGEGLTTMLRGQDLRDSLVDQSAAPALDADALAGPFAHIIVDEAQELTDAEWQMLLSRCPSRSFTVVGDRAQARNGFTESWTERLERTGFRSVTMASLSINYRTPEEIMTEAEPVIRAALPDANVPTSIRSSGLPVIHGPVSDRDTILADWAATHAEGTACVIGDPTFDATSGTGNIATGPQRFDVRSLSPEHAKGLEFDLVILVDPAEFGTGVRGAVDRYVAMTRATLQLVVLTTPDQAPELSR
ncbi:RNA polymerase recycling motor ATPase HelR [Gordonia insulae]|uniref:DNA helicase IV n=1 Tax=Gordonia insulae TaxID=2420509 RepID=A0A3G8JNI7_9ACTN|nr:RNA polymerase recycling motor ATPase HelR [Gordonia insulae]AZG46576.1 DNA helicase IV [Gordonia insulae]